MIFESLLPCSRLILAVVLPVAPAPAECASSTITLLPALANSTAVTRPVIPAPTTATSACRSVSSKGLGGDGRIARLASHNEVMNFAIPGKGATKRNRSKACWRNTVQTACSRSV